jgi:hypothetical protein
MLTRVHAHPGTHTTVGSAPLENPDDAANKAEETQKSAAIGGLGCSTSDVSRAFATWLNPHPPPTKAAFTIPAGLGERPLGPNEKLSRPEINMHSLWLQRRKT